MSPDALAGRTVAVTRPAGRGGSLISRLRRLGADVVAVPLIAVEAPSSGEGALSRAMARQAEFDWVVVTSVTAVDRIAGRLAPARAGRPRWAAVGPATSARLEGAGVEVSLVPTLHQAAALAEEFPHAPAGGGRVLVVQAEEPIADVAGALASKGWSVDSAPAYRTVPTEPTPAELETLRTVDLITLASPSAAMNLVRVGVRDIPVACIGHATAETARGQGLEVVAVADAPSAAAFTAAVMAAVGLDA